MNDRTRSEALLIFGNDAIGDTLKELARSSSVSFVRTQFQLAIALPRSTGYRLTALDALEQYGWTTLSGLAYYTSVPLVEHHGEPFISFRKRADDLGLDLKKLQHDSGWSDDETAAFGSNRQVGFRLIDRLAIELGIRQEDIGKTILDTDSDLGARLRSLKSEGKYTLTEDVTVKISSAARLAADHYALVRRYSDDIWSTMADDHSKLISRLAEAKSRLTAQMAPWEQGFLLAHEFRDVLGCPADEPIRRISTLIEDRLEVLLLCAEIDARVTGIAIEHAGGRAIFINSGPYAVDIFIKRIALVHELCHVLVDSSEEFASVRVDQDRIFDDDIAQIDRVEARVNAFAVELLAPQKVLCDGFEEEGRNYSSIPRMAARFGVSRGVVRRQLVDRI
jgi:hypothetical protein